MRELLVSAILATLAVLCCASPAFAHGGAFAAPNAGPSVLRGSAPSGASGGNSASGGAPATGVPGGVASPEGWEFWWEANKDRYLNLRSHLGSHQTASGDLGVLSGKGRRTPDAWSNRPTHDDIMLKIVPNLLGLIGSEDDGNILDSSILALARSVPADAETKVFEAALSLLAHNELSVQTSATISLGVLGTKAGVDVLTALMMDTSVGRRAVGGGEVPRVVRAFGALGLGFIDHPRSVQSLVRVIETLPDSERDTKVCAIVALGLMENELIHQAVPVLIEQLENRRLDTYIKSFIPTTLAKMAGGTLREAVVPLLDAFKKRSTDDAVRQSVAIGLGRLATMADTDVVDALSDYATRGRDVQTRHFAFISLGKIGARDTSPDERRGAHAALVRLLGKETLKPSEKSNAPWAAIASALYARGEAHSDRRNDIADRLWGAYGDTRNASHRAACVIALALMGANEHAPTLYGDFLDSKDNDFRGYAAVALGLMGFDNAKPVFRGMIQSKSVPPTVRLQLATSLGLLGDQGAIDLLVSTLETTKTLGVSSAVAKAMGLIGNASALPPLLAVANDGRKPSLARAFAAVGLGLVAERGELPFNARLSEDNNYRPRVPALDEILAIL